MARNPFLDGALKVVREVALRALDRASRPQTRRRAAPKARPTRTRRTDRATATDGYPGDFTGRPDIVYSPHRDGRPDPGEVVWTWVPYEEGHSEGKDRPVLLIGRDGAWLLGLQVTSQDHDRDAAQEAAAGRYWMDIGTGEWDSQHRPSEVRLNRIVRIDPDAVRRVGAILSQGIFEDVAREVLRHY
ncbi:type II toxin-antitoxin system PemK/MazF family toxin [Tessaracoccus sp. Z1128]